MYGVLDRRFEQRGHDRQERLMLSFDKMFAREKGGALWELFRFWQDSAANAGTVPGDSEFPYKEKLPGSVTRYLSWSDVSPGDPYNFVTHEHTRQTAFADHSNRRLGDHPAPMNAKACAAEYLHCVRMQQPTYYEIVQNFGTINRHMVRLMVPVAGKSGAITKLVYAVRIISASSPSSGGCNSPYI